MAAHSWEALLSANLKLLSATFFYENNSTILLLIENPGHPQPWAQFFVAYVYKYLSISEWTLPVDYVVML